jgi:hypothetical protein
MLITHFKFRKLVSNRLWDNHLYVNKINKNQSINFIFIYVLGPRSDIIRIKFELSRFNSSNKNGFRNVRTIIYRKKPKMLITFKRFFDCCAKSIIDTKTIYIPLERELLGVSYWKKIEPIYWTLNILWYVFPAKPKTCYENQPKLTE